MSKILRVSRQGLSRCPACQTHVDVAGTSATCPSCHEVLTEPAGRQGTIGRSVARLLSGSTAGALGAVLGISMTTACGVKATDPAKVAPIQAAEPPQATIYGGPGMMGAAPIDDEPPAPPPPRRTTLKLEGAAAVGELVDVYLAVEGAPRRKVADEVRVVAVRPGEVDVMLEGEAARLEPSHLSVERRGPAPPPVMAPVYGGPPGPRPDDEPEQPK